MNAVLIPLPMASAGVMLEVVRIDGGRDLTKRLADMGLMAGSQFRMIKAGLQGPLLLEVKDTRLGLGVGAGQKIMVKEVADE